MEIKKIKITDIIPAEYNPRKISNEEFNKLSNSLNEFGLVDPIIINLKNNKIIGGHQRYEVLLDTYMQDNDFFAELNLLELGDVGWIFTETDLKIKSADHEKALNLALNKISGEWDFEKLTDLLEDLELNEFDITLTGFEDIDKDLINIKDNNLFQEDDVDYTKGKLVDWYENGGENTGILIDKYIVPPFSVFNTNMGYWDKRKEYWDNLIQDKGESRENAISDGMGTSLLNSTLAEVILHWFTPNKNSEVFDTFAGDTVFGFVASKMGHNFKGIELRKEQADLNNERVQPINPKSIYYNDDGQNVLKYIEKNSQDLFFSCPPYFDLEVYSDLPNDASNQETYEDFLKILENAFIDSIKCLKENRFAVIVCGDIRDKKGFYYGFPSDIINIFTKNGMGLYNEIVLYNKIGTGRMRAHQSFKNKKVVKVHQNVYVFYKGNPNNIKEHYPVISDESYD